MSRRVLATLLAVALPLLAALLAPPAHAAGEDYVAIGDSYASGVGTNSYTLDSDCRRSTKAYPYLLRSTFGTSHASYACSGAVVPQVLTQANQITSATKFVTVQVGGNDAGFVDVLTACAAFGDCNAGATNAENYIRNTLPGKLDELYTKIRQRSATANVTVVGYPRLFSSASCGGVALISGDERTRLNGTADLMAETLRARAAAHGFTFADVRSAFVGHAVCSNSEWVNGFSLFSISESFHPSTPGQNDGYRPVVSSAMNAAVPPAGTTISAGPTGTITTRTPRFTFAVTGAVAAAKYECRVDAAAFATCSSPHTTASLADGTHTFQVRAVNAAGIPQRTATSRTFTVDATAPVAPTITDAVSPSSSPRPTISFTHPEAGVTFQCAVDAGAYAACASPFTAPDPLDDGEHVLRVRAVDAATNTGPAATASVVVERVLAATPTVTSPSAPTSGTTASFTFTSDEDAVAFRCAVDGGEPAPCLSPLVLEDLDEGTHTVAVVALNAAGKPSAAGIGTVVVDRTAPTTTLTEWPASPSSDTTPLVRFGADEDDVTFACRIDDEAFASCASPFIAAEELADGPHTFAVQATDAAGNVEATPVTHTFTVDTTAPEAPTLVGPQGPTTDTTPSFTIGGAEDGLTFECAVGSGEYASCTSPFTTAPLADGEHWVHAVAIDAAGNRSEPVDARVVVDLTAPATTITSGPEGLVGTGEGSFAFTADDEDATFACRVDDDAFADCTSPFAVTGLEDGAHTVEVRATDALGNEESPAASRSFTVDTTAPGAPTVSGPARTKDRTPSFTLTATEADVTYACAVDGGDVADCTSPFTPSALDDGSHTITAIAIDAAGNRSAEGSATVVVDTAAPLTTITSGPQGPVGSADGSFAFTADDADATFACRVDDDAFADCTSPFVVSGLDDGAHTVEVRATDALGNVESPAASRSFTVDTTAPDAPTVTAPASPTADTTPSFTLASDEDGVTFQCAVDGGDFAGCTSPFTPAALGDGSHTVKAVAIDALGNRSGEGSATVVVDTTAPVTTITAGPAGTVKTATPQFTFTADDPDATFACAIDGGEFAACASPYTTAALADRAHTFAVRATDALGNVESPAVTRTFTVDTSVPPVPQPPSVPSGGGTTPPAQTTPPAAVTPPVTGGDASRSNPVVLPVLSNVRLARKVLAGTSGPKARTLLRWRLSKAAQVTVKLERRTGTKLVPARAVTVRAKAGDAKLSVAVRRLGRTLKPGTYRLTVTPKGGKAVRLTLRVTA